MSDIQPRQKQTRRGRDESERLLLKLGATELEEHFVRGETPARLTQRLSGTNLAGSLGLRVTRACTLINEIWGTGAGGASRSGAEGFFRAIVDELRYPFIDLGGVSHRVMDHPTWTSLVLDVASEVVTSRVEGGEDHPAWSAYAGTEAYAILDGKSRRAERFGSTRDAFCRNLEFCLSYYDRELWAHLAALDGGLMPATNALMSVMDSRQTYLSSDPVGCAQEQTALLARGVLATS